MKNVIKNFVCIVIFAFCHSSGRLFLTNGYSFDVFAHMKYEYQGQILEGSVKLKPTQSYAMDAAGRNEYKHIISIWIESIDRVVIAEYPAEYLEQIRSAYKKICEKKRGYLQKKGYF